MSLRTESEAFLGDGLYENGRRKAYGEAVYLLYRKFLPIKQKDYMSLRTESGAFLGDGLYENGRRKAYGEAVFLYKKLPLFVSKFPYNRKYLPLTGLGKRG